MTNLIHSINAAVSAGQTFDITAHGTIQICSAWKRFVEWTNRAYRLERVNRILDVLKKALQEMPRSTIEKAMNNSAVNASRKFLRTLSPAELKEPEAEVCCKILLAAKLGIPYKAFEVNEGFIEFAFRTHLDRYLLDYGHEIRFSEETNEISLLCGGKYLPWSEINKIYATLKEPEPNFPGNPKAIWSYGQQGIQKLDMYAWKELKPYKIEENPSWGNRYIFEFAACCGQKVQLTGDHTWLRLKNPKGEIYCTGLYRPGKSQKSDNFKLPLRVQKGYLMSPDVSEFYPSPPIYRIEVEITEKQFNTIKTSVEEDKQQEESRTFQLFKGNCTQYVNSKALLAGIQLPTSLHYLRNVAPLPLQEKVDRAMSKVPKIINTICQVIITFLSNVLQVCLGAHVIDSKVEAAQVDGQPHIASFFDLFNEEKLYFHPPRHLGFALRGEIEAWRKQAALDPSKYGFAEKDKEDITYKLPKEYQPAL